MKNLIISVLFLIISIPVYSIEFSFPDALIKIPQGFEGPQRQSMGNGASSIAFTKKHSDGQNATLLQISIWAPGQKFPEMSDEELKQGSTQYLMQFLAGLSRQRTNFKKSEVEYITISGIPAAKIKWDGNVGDKSVHGVMYCYVFNSKIVSLHTQDLAEFEGFFTKLAEDSFESITLAR